MQIKNFIHNETSGAVFLFLATILAILCANSGLEPFYASLLGAPVKIGVSVFNDFYGLDKPLFLWVNDALMTLFFMLLGLEIKRELIAGELSTRSKALQPLFAAIGGVVVPIICFLAMTYQSPDVMRGWAIPCATDLAFALGIIAFLGNRVPSYVKILLTALAIIDDLIAIIIVAVFYTETIYWFYFVYVAIGGAALFALNRLNITKARFYLLAGAVAWYGMLKAGLHPTLAGVMTAMALPLRIGDTAPNKSPLVRLENKLHPYVSFLVVPVFAFFNAGLRLADVTPNDFVHPLTMGIMAGLIIGKPVGIMLGIYIGHISGLARKAASKPWANYVGMAFLCGIGFTMSLFIGDLSFIDDAGLINRVKLGVLGGSIIPAIIGWSVYRFNLVARFSRVAS